MADEIYRRVVNAAQSEDEVRQILAELVARLEIIESHIGNTWPMTANTSSTFTNVSLNYSQEIPFSPRVQ